MIFFYLFLQAPQIPLEISKQINNLTNYESFFEMLEDDSADNRRVLVSKLNSKFLCVLYFAVLGS